MWKLFDKEKIDILKMTQDNLTATQQNNQMMAQLLSEQLQDKTQLKSICQESLKEDVEEQKKREALKAAYALNLCTVSVSQIIEYNDLGFLENEYDAILNNLNLEKMPKDESLLRILKQLLDVITFFRIQEGDRKMMEKEYNQRMKDAIWSAVPNLSMIVATGNPIGIAISLASQVGIGYMNYRKEKAKIGLDKDRKEWELQKSAIEQFNGLRRELFDTAWRLADEYGFPDEYRITERQISQFNNILLDVDDLRRYERLEYICDKFKAYPPFWYYLGSAANAVYLDERYPESIREEYKDRALKHFGEFLSITEENLLREDQLVASCALEMFDLIEDKSERIKLLEKAIKTSGSAFDVLQMCAIYFLKIGEIDESCNLLKMLVNEGYNITLNAKLLSRIYVSKIINGDDEYRNKYELLARSVGKRSVLFTMPEKIPQTDEEKEALSLKFIESQRENLLDEFATVMEDYINKCEYAFNSLCKQSGNIVSKMAKLIESTGDSIRVICDEAGESRFIANLKDSFNDNTDFYKMLENGEERQKENNSVSFYDVFENAFVNVAEELHEKITGVNDMAEVSILESLLNEFLSYNNIENNTDSYSFSSTTEIEELFGEELAKKYANGLKIEECLSVMKAGGYNQDTIITKANKAEFFTNGDKRLKEYLERRRGTFVYNIPENSIIAVLSDKSAFYTDLVFTTNKVYVTRWVYDDAGVRYKDIYLDKGGNKLRIGNSKYDNTNVNLNNLEQMIGALATVSEEHNAHSEAYSLATKINEIIKKGMNN